jgi:hypothetical protein
MGIHMVLVLDGVKVGFTSVLILDSRFTVCIDSDECKEVINEEYNILQVYLRKFTSVQCKFCI